MDSIWLFRELEDEMKGEVKSEFQVGRSWICRISEKEQVTDGREMMDSAWDTLSFRSQVEPRGQLNFISGAQKIWL